MKSRSLVVPPDHPSYAGHFPGMPVLPGVVLLDLALLTVAEATPAGELDGWDVGSAKFHSAVLPGEPLTLQHEILPNGSVRFAIRTTDRPVASGTFVLRREPHGQ